MELQGSEFSTLGTVEEHQYHKRSSQRTVYKEWVQEKQFPVIVVLLISTEVLDGHIHFQGLNFLSMDWKFNDTPFLYSQY